MTYTATGKRDTTYLGQFTLDTLMDFEGLAKVLTIIARGYLFHHSDGSLADNPRGQIEHARRALCAWCSIPDKKLPHQKRSGSFRQIFETYMRSSQNW